MRGRLPRLNLSRLEPRLQQFYIAEAALVGLFWRQALRFLIGSVYSRIGSAAVVAVLDPASIEPNTPGVAHPSVVSGEISFLVYMIALPLTLLLVGRIRWVMFAGVLLVAGGRALMLTGGASISPTTAAALALGGGLVYIGMVTRRRTQVLPLFFIMGLSFDQLYRAVGNTLDPSWSPRYADIQIVLSIAAALLSLFTVYRQQREELFAPSNISPDQGVLTLAGGVGLGAMLFLELSLLALPNAIAGRAKVDYTSFAPAVMVATLLPLVPWVRKQARAFIALFDPGARGWSWMLLTALLVVFGTRFQGIAAGAALVAAQFTVSLMWWWLARPQAEKERNLTGLWLVVTALIFGLLVVFDNFTYDYAFVRNLSPELAFLNNIVPPLLRGFRGMGLAVILLAIFLAAIPMAQSRRRIPWTGGTAAQSVFGLLIVAGFGVGAAYAGRPPLVTGVRDVDRLRIATYNIHGGFSEFFHFDLESIALTIQESGANVVLLQEVEAGRMTSFGVDEPLWLARRLRMDRRFFPTNEGLQGLAVLSNVPIVFDDGTFLTSVTNQTGLQRVQIQPDSGVITLYNTWLGYAVVRAPGDPLDDSEQQAQLSEIFALIASHHPTGVLGRTVIGGAFNNVPDSPLIERMKGTGFTDPFAGQPIELSATLRRTGLRARFDYLWLRNVTPIGALVMAGSASDHRLAVTEVVITRQGG